MEAQEQAKLKKLLLAKKAEFEESTTGLTEAHPEPVSSIDANDGAHDKEDVATDFIEMQKEQTLLANEQSLWKLVDIALKRINTQYTHDEPQAREAGNTSPNPEDLSISQANPTDIPYGLCLRCGKPIPLKRLEALPWAEHDVQCEALLEAQDPSLEDAYEEPQTF